MAGQSWNVNIDPTQNGVSFDPDIPGVAAGSPLQAEQGDLISWANLTQNKHNLVVGTEQFPVDPNKSTTAYQVQTAAPAKISYTCSLHTGEDGTIEVVA